MVAAAVEYRQAEKNTPPVRILIHGDHNETKANIA